MERRRFLGHCAAYGLSTAFGKLAHGASSESLPHAVEDNSEAIPIADPHAHPYQLYGSRSYDSSTPTIEIAKKAGMKLCAFSAVGDMTRFRVRSGMPFNDTQQQLKKVKRLEESGELRLVLNPSHVKAALSASPILSGLMAIEGGDALEGQLGNLDIFHDYGVRLITVMHDHDNEIGFNQRSAADGPLTSFGVQVIERMNKLGMVVDVAHAKTGTLKSIAEVCAGPLIDSHTSPLANGEDGPGLRRLRTWAEMEIIAKSDGVVCTWPFAYIGKHSERTTLTHWAEELVQMKSRLGIEHCGLGTDGGGGIPRLVEGWESIASLPNLLAAMRAAGLTKGDIAAFVGGNFLRVLRISLA